MADPFVLYVGDLSPAITDTILVDGVAPVGMVSAKFQTRPVDSPTAGWTIDAAASTFNTTTGAITYAWAPGDSDADQAGLYAARWLITLAGGSTQTKDAGHVLIVPFGEQTDPSTFDLCDIDDVKLVVGLDNRNRDAAIAAAITAASAAITNRYQREFAPMGTLTRTFLADGTRLDLAPYDLATLTSVTLYPEDNPTVTTRYTDFDLGPADPLLGTYGAIRFSRSHRFRDVSRYRFGTINVAIAGVWGAQTIHPDVRRAAAITAGSWIDRGVQDYGIPDIGDSGMAVRPDRPSTWAIPAAAHRLLQPFERWTYA